MTGLCSVSDDKNPDQLVFFVDYEGVAPGHYLWLKGKAAGFLLSTGSFPTEIPAQK
jgi:hypothetical protein